MPDSAASTFTRPLLEWYRIHKRALPWRETTDAYRIWVSEIMLQQTRVDQATPYYHRFLDAFPDVYALAHAEQHKVLMLWEGLGYYSRARNMHASARIIVNEFNGVFPDDWHQMRSLKGIGDYTAAAILSIAYNKPYAVVDGNVLRVITRYLGDENDIRLASVKTRIQTIVSSWIPHETPADFNQAVMELGATVCVPVNPKCGECPVQNSCISYNTVKTDVIPYKSTAKKIPHHTIVVGIIYNQNGRMLIAKRPEKAMLGGLWEFPGGKKEAGETLETALQREITEELGITISNITLFHTLRHSYSHFKITMHAFTCTLFEGEPEPKSSTELKWVNLNELMDYPFPKANRALTKALIAGSSE